MPVFVKFDGVDGESSIIGDDQFNFKDVEPEGTHQTREHILLANAPEDDTGLLMPIVQSAREAARYSEAPDDDDGCQGDYNAEGVVDFFDFM